MTSARSIFLGLAWALAAGAALAADPVKLDKAQIEKMLPGKSLSYSNVNGSIAIVHFAPDGRVTYKTGNGKASVGTWTIEDDGRYCIQITSGTTRDHCRHVWKTDSGYSTGNGKGDNLVPLSGLD
jgi:hypothetical protein